MTPATGAKEGVVKVLGTDCAVTSGGACGVTSGGDVSDVVGVVAGVVVAVEIPEVVLGSDVVVVAARVVGLVDGAVVIGVVGLMAGWFLFVLPLEAFVNASCAKALEPTSNVPFEFASDRGDTFTERNAAVINDTRMKRFTLKAACITNMNHLSLKGCFILYRAARGTSSI